MVTKILFLLAVLYSLFILQASAEVAVIGFVKPETIHVGDNTLADWNDIKPINTLKCGSQWQNPICGKAPDSCRSDLVDLQASFYLAWDGSYLFFAVSVIDDKVLSVPSTDKELYRGDSAELFFVKECESYSDYHDCVSLNKPVFQLLLSPIELKNKRYNLARYRTPESIIQNALHGGFKATGWETNNGWQAEAAFPLTTLNETKIINWGGKRVKVSFDILDYDHSLVEWEEPCWGYKPDHVISNVEKKEIATNPTQMPEFVFEVSK